MPLRIPQEDLQWITTHCGPEVVESLLRQAQDTGWSDLHLRRPVWTSPGTSYNGAVLFVALVAPPPQQLVVKVICAGLPGTEAAAHTEALKAAEQFTRQHLVDQPHPSLDLPDGRTVMFQEVAGDSLTDVFPAGALPHEERKPVIEAVVRGLLSDWNKDVLKDAGLEQTTVSEFLRRELNDVWRRGGSLQAFGQELRVLDPAPPWLYSDGMRLPNPYLLVEGGHSALTDPVITILRGLGHGDLHLDNVLVPREEKLVQPQAYRLIDLCTFSVSADLGRDVATLLLSALVPHVDHQQELPPDQRHALIRFIVDPDAAHRARIVPEAADLVATIRLAAREAMRGWGDPWERQFLLSLMATALRFTTYTKISEAGRTWFARLAAHAGGEVLARSGGKGAEARLSPLEPGRDSFSMAAGFGRVGPAAREWAAEFVPDEVPRRRLWDTRTGAPDELAVVGFGPDDTVVAIDGKGGVRRWTASGDELPGTTGRAPRLRLGHQSLVASLTHTVLVARPKQLEITHFPQGGRAIPRPPVPLGNGEHFLVTSGGDVFATHDRHQLTVRDFEDGTPIETLSCPPSMMASAVSIDASVIAMASSREVHIYRRGQEPLRRSVANSLSFLPRFMRKTTPDPGLQLAVSPSGSHVGCVTFEEVVVWRTSDGGEMYSRKLTKREGREALGAKGMRLICTETGTLFWLRRGRLSIPTMDGGTQLEQSGTGADVALSRDGRLIALLSTDGRLEVRAH
ncbi:hypothetical protein [Streptomyces marianii]|uniref:Uncharacterized protein n=1 Tax=Streptomyces marianii TaxID=1817406 RepID=A0A5R9E1T7_9ACTN|nr:hypothetical protein [Streptomyces marianii]TLQ41973.1 hypothetical protein FEF34_00595 [Streptomyces marianii]